MFRKFGKGRSYAVAHRHMLLGRESHLDEMMLGIEMKAVNCNKVMFYVIA